MLEKHLTSNLATSSFNMKLDFSAFERLGKTYSSFLIIHFKYLDVKKTYIKFISIPHDIIIVHNNNHLYLLRIVFNIKPFSFKFIT